MTRTLLKSILCFVLALSFILAAGCTQAAQTPSTSTGAATASTSAQTSAASPSSSQSQVNIDKDATCTVTFYAVCYRYDPQKTTSYGDWCIINQLYDTLLVTDFDGKTLKPGLATDWKVSDDGLKITFNLKKNVKFHSGKPMTSADVKYTLERWVDAKTASPTKGYVKNITSIETPDDYTVVINLKQLDNNLLVYLTVPCAGILNKEAVDKAGDSYGTSAVDGTGPYKFDKYIQDDRTILMRNDNYAWAPDIYTNRGAPYLKQMVFRFIPEAGTRSMEYQAGNIDIMGNASMYASELDALKKSLNFFAVQEFSPPYPVFLQFQLDRGPDQIVRKACNMAVERTEYIKTVLNGYGTPMVGAMPPGYWDWEGGKTYYKYDIEGAKKLLEDNGYKLGNDGFRYKDGKKLSFSVIMCSSNEDKKVAEIFQAQMKKVGIDVVVDTSKQNQFFTFINTNEFQCLVMGLFLNTPEDMLYRYLHSSNLPYPNRQSFKNSEVDKLLDQALVAKTDQERRDCYNKIQEIALDTAVWVGIYNRNGFIVYNNNLKGLKVHPTCVEGVPKAIDLYKEKK